MLVSDEQQKAPSSTVLTELKTVCCMRCSAASREAVAAAGEQSRPHEQVHHQRQ